MPSFRKRNLVQRHGVTAVEFALTAPVFLLVLMAIFEFGWQNVIRHTADNAAYEATRVAIVPGATAAEARAEANRIMSIVGTRGASVTITPSAISNATQSVQVSIRVPCNQNGLVLSRFLRDATFDASAAMLTERVRQ